MSLEELLSRIVTALSRAEVPYMVTGSVASSTHGEPRSTRDLDIVIAPTHEQLRALMREFPTDRYYADEQQALSALAKRSQFNVIDFATGWKTDFIIAQDSAYGRSELGRRMTKEVGGIRVYFSAPEDLIIAKLQWAKLGESGRQLEDVAGIVRVQADKLDIPYVERWVRELELEDFWERVRTGQF
jgi:hypothetical protein